jgi:putative addiction module killer protein
VSVTVRVYVTSDGKRPYNQWLAMLEWTTRQRVESRVFRFEQGNLGDHKPLMDGLWEARLAFGPGYRVYFGKDGTSTVVILSGGTKATQRDDIRRARRFWADYLNGDQDG